jgi:hypothetical protein
VRRLLAAALVVALTTSPLEAQSGRIPRKWLVAGIGAAVMGGVAAIYAANFDRDVGGCSDVTCVVPVSIGFGALLGFMIGSEMDKLYNARYSHAPPIDLRGRSLSLAVVPNDVSVFDSTVVVTGQEGIEVIRAGPRLDRLGFRARGLRGIGPVAAEDARNLLLVGSTVGLYRFPLRGDEAGTLAYPGEISALSGDGALLAIGLGPDLQLARVSDSLVPVGPLTPQAARVTALAWHGTTRLWVLTEERLAAYDVVNDSLVARGAVPLPSLGRRLALTDSLAFVAAGSGGVFAVDIANPDRLTVRANWSGARFAYDVAVFAGVTYVAAGPEGLYLLRLRDQTFTPVGLSRGAGFAAAVEAGPDGVYLLDRTSGQLRRLEPPAK